MQSISECSPASNLVGWNSICEVTFFCRISFILYWEIDPRMIIYVWLRVWITHKKRSDNHIQPFAVRTGLEPVTPCVTGMYSNQLNYRTIHIGCFPNAVQR